MASASAADPAELRPISRAYQFATAQFAAAFGDLPDAGPAYADRLRADAVAHARTFDARAAWTADPIISLLRGKALLGGARVETRDAFGRVNGAMVHATPAQVDELVAHVCAYVPPVADLRAQVRALEAEYLTPGSAAAAMLVANQALDFGKQDGVTEMVENVEAAAVERRLADGLLADEAAGAVVICRAPAFVACVSNFSNFLDLSRKVLRNLELGVPVVVLSRSNTSQHSFRWAADLNKRLAAHGVDAGMFSFLAAPLDEQQRAIAACQPACPLYFTGSRPVAAAIRASHRRTFASTGGPNTLVATATSEAVCAAVRLSATIEHSGQCTALRHAVVPCDAARGAAMLSGAPQLADAIAALEAREFGALLADASELPGAPPSSAGYERIAPGLLWRRSGALPSAALEEHWRHAVVDLTAPPSADALRAPAYVAALAAWLVEAQPISLAVNDARGARGFALARALFEQTAVVVFTAGDLERPALTCQARPQEGEVFGEVPPRAQLRAHTCAPVLVPSPTPAYNSGYADAYLAAKGRAWLAGPPAGAPVAVRALVELAAAHDGADGGLGGELAAGYCAELLAYLEDACAQNPKRGKGGGRTTLYGLQTTPLGPDGRSPGALTIFRVCAGVRAASLCAHLLPFVATSAAPAARVSADPADARAAALAAELVRAGVLRAEAVALEDIAVFEARAASERAFNVLGRGTFAELEEARALGVGLPLAGQLVSALLCFGHAKSTRPDDELFLAELGGSAKWLAMAR